MARAPGNRAAEAAVAEPDDELNDKLIEKGSPLRPLHLACASAESNDEAYTETIRALLEAGADVHLGGNPREASAALAVLRNHFLRPAAAMALLVAHGLDLSAPPEAAEMLRIAAHHSLDMLTCVVSAGLLLSAQSLDSTLQQTARAGLRWTSEADQGRRKAELGAVIHKLVSLGARINAQDPNCGATALHGAYTDAIGPLLECGADLEARDGSGSTPLHEAADRNDGSAMCALVLAGADLGARNRHGNTPEEVSMDWTLPMAQKIP